MVNGIIFYIISEKILKKVINGEYVNMPVAHEEVYVGEDEMPEGYSFKVNPNAEIIDWESYVD
jgi:hypothetical protein